MEERYVPEKGPLCFQSSMCSDRGSDTNSEVAVPRCRSRFLIVMEREGTKARETSGSGLEKEPF